MTNTENNLKKEIEWKNWTERDKHFFDIGKLDAKSEIMKKVLEEIEKIPVELLGNFQKLEIKERLEGLK